MDCNKCNKINCDAKIKFVCVEGPIGPTGLVGPQGDRGTQGPQGPQGPRGPSTTSTTGTNYMYINGDKTPPDNAVDVINAYNQIKMTFPLALDNRYVILLQPGYYHFLSDFVMDTPYLDLSSTTGQPDVFFQNASIDVQANDIRVTGIDLLTNPFKIAGGLDLLVVKDCKSGPVSFTDGNILFDLRGTYIRCVCGGGSFFTSVDNGYFENCTVNGNAFGQSIYDTQSKSTLIGCIVYGTMMLQTTGSIPTETAGYSTNGDAKVINCYSGNDGNVIEFYYLCLAKGTKILLADGTHRNIEDIRYTDVLTVWNFDEGRFDESLPLWIKQVEVADSYNLLTFSDGTTLKTIGQHRIFNREAGKFTYPMTDEGTTTFTEDGKEITLISKEIIRGEVEYYNVITNYHLNLFANTVLTSCRYNNMYPIKDMKFIKENRIIHPMSEFNIGEEYYIGLRVGEQTFEKSEIESYVERLQCKRK